MVISGAYKNHRMDEYQTDNTTYSLGKKAPQQLVTYVLTYMLNHVRIHPSSAYMTDTIHLEKEAE